MTTDQLPETRDQKTETKNQRPKTQTGILLINLGTPDAPDRRSVYRYLKQFLLDRRVIDIPWFSRNLLVRGIIAPFRSKPSSDLYKKLWTKDGSPIKYYGYKLKDDLGKLLGDEYVVELGMRYQSPSIESAVQSLLKEKLSEIIVLPLFPQYASASTGSALEEVMRVMSKYETILPLKLITSFYDHPGMIKIFADNARKHGIDQYDHFLFSFHGLPQRQLIKSDNHSHCLQSENCCNTICSANQHCYSAQCYATAYAIAEELGLSEDKYTICFQSRLGKDPWTEPFTPDIIELRKEKGDKSLLVFSPAFVADCLETTIEIGYEYKEEFAEMGGEKLDLVESLNNNPAWTEAVKDIILSHQS